MQQNTHLRRLVIDGSKHRAVYAAVASLSPFLPLSTPIIVLNDATSVAESVSSAIDSMRTAIVMDREQQSQPFQYVYGEKRNADQVKASFARIHISVEDSVSESDDVTFLLILDSSEGVSQNLHRLSNLMTVVSSGSRSLLIVGDEVMRKHCTPLLSQCSSTVSRKIACCWVPLLSPPSLEYALTEACVADEAGMESLLPVAAMGFLLGLSDFKNVTQKTFSFVPVDIAVNIALFFWVQAQDRAAGISVIKVQNPPEAQLPWAAIREWLGDYFSKNQKLISSVVGPSSTASDTGLFPWRKWSEPLLDSFTDHSTRERELLFHHAVPETYERLERCVMQIKYLEEHGVLCSQGSSLSFPSAKVPHSKVLTDRRATAINRDATYSSIMRKVSATHESMQLIQAVSTLLVDWSMYIRLIARASVYHFRNHVERQSNFHVILPLPSRGFIDAQDRSTNQSYGEQVLGGLSYYRTSGLLENGKFIVRTPGLTPQRMSSILSQPDVMRIMTSLRLQDGVSQEEIRARAKKIVLRIGDNLNDFDSRALGSTAAYFMSNIYKSVRLNSGAFEKLRGCLKLPRVQVVVIPQHRSYADFIIVSLLLGIWGLPLPHVVSGEDFLKMGALSNVMRGAGAFFMRRSFKNDPLYAILFREYIRHLVLNQQLIEFFIEGSRSRSAKMLKPKMGILKFITDAFFDGQNEVTDVIFVPISLSYDQLLEAPLYAKELLGVPKPKETVSNMFKGWLSLQKEYGSIQLAVGDPVSLVDTANSLLSSEALSTMQRSVPLTNAPLKGKSYTPPQLLHRLASSISGRMQGNVVITPSAIVAASLECFRLTDFKCSMFDASTLADLPLAMDVSALKQWVIERGGSLSDAASQSEVEGIVEKGLHHLSSFVTCKKVNGREDFRLIAPVDVSSIVVNMSTNQLIHLFYDEAVVSLVALAHGKTVLSSNGEKVTVLSAEAMNASVAMVLKVLSEEFPSFSMQSEDERRHQAILRLQGTSDASVIRIPCSRLLCFTSRLLFPHIEAVFIASVGIQALVTVLPSSKFSVRTVVASLHKLMLAFLQEHLILSAVTCSLDPIRHHLDSLVKLSILQLEVTSAGLVYLPGPAAVEQIQEVVEHLRKVRASSPLATELITSSMITTYNTLATLAKV